MLEFLINLMLFGGCLAIVAGVTIVSRGLIRCIRSYLTDCPKPVKRKPASVTLDAETLAEIKRMKALLQPASERYSAYPDVDEELF